MFSIMPRRLPGGIASGVYPGVARGMLPEGCPNKQRGGMFSEVSNWLIHYFQQFFSISFSAPVKIYKEHFSILFFSSSDTPIHI